MGHVTTDTAARFNYRALRLELRLAGYTLTLEAGATLTKPGHPEDNRQ